MLNDSNGVLVEVEGTPRALTAFLARLEAQAPPLATVERIDSNELSPRGESGFEILASDSAGEPAAPVSPDSATCADCLAELFDPRDRRHRYPFINCTNCGPRFTIVKGVPYDRALTTMAGFEMCGRCRAEYEDPLDRRFHAQPNACPACGPRVRLCDALGADVDLAAAADAVAAAAAAILAGSIVAIKGLGGYHLACRADDEGAVAALRARKHREEKPFALMVRDRAAAEELVELGAEEAAVLCSGARPIVLAGRRQGGSLASALAPGAPELGVMLPYTPLHHLLLADCRLPLVMTSGNSSEEPIAYEDADALERLGSIADLFLVHDRPIQTRTDDSVARLVAIGEHRRPLLLRRSRGYVPVSLQLPLECRRPLLACGAELKSTFCLGKGGRAWVGHHIGDLENLETLRSFTTGIEHFRRLFAIEPEICVHDLHPDYLSSKYALAQDGLELLAVQHHHAHLAACLAEHGERGPAVGAIYDGTGYGLDGTVWGGELLVGGLDRVERGAHLRSVALPGGSAAIREPWRMACAWLSAALGPHPDLPAVLAPRVDARDWRNCCRLVETGLNSPATTSMGRLFDAVAALCGATVCVSYEGQAAIELEALADRDERGRHEIPLIGSDPVVLDPVPALLAAIAELDSGRPPRLVAARFHNAVAAATAVGCSELASEHGTELVVLSGGVFQNRLLLERTSALLEAAGLRVLIPELLPPNDGGISFGQAAVAAAIAG